MSSCIKDIAKIVTGVAASETLGHWWLGLIGTRFLPLDFGWFTFTREANWVAMAGWPLLLVACIWAGWRRTETRSNEAGVGPRSAPSA